MPSKETLRISFLNIRRSLSMERREEAKKNLLPFFKTRLASFQKVLSFASTKEEIDLWPLNEWLLKEGKLLFTKIEGKKLLVFCVKDLSCDLSLNPSFPILEPNEKLCSSIELSPSDCILVPGVAFDKNRYRLGYGQGFYDRLLKKTSAYSIGVGFKEQLSSSPLPIKKHDQKLDEIALF